MSHESMSVQNGEITLLLHPFIIRVKNFKQESFEFF